MKTKWTVKFNSLKPLALLAAGGLATQLASGQCVPPPPGLVAWWPGDNSTADYAGTNQGILRNGASFGTGKVGQAFALPGGDSYIEFPASATLLCTTAITVEAWINPSSSSGSIVSQYNTHRGTWRFYFQHVAGKLDFGVSRDGALFGVYRSATTAEAVVESNVWTHVAATFDASTQAIRFYANAIELATQFNDSSAVDVINPSDEPVRVGTSVCVDGNLCIPYTGLVDEVGIYNRALSDSEVATIYAAGSAGKCRLRFTVQPASQVGFWGRDIAFSAAATNASGAAISYQWQKDGVAITNATSTTLTLTNLQLTDAGAYTVVATDTAGSVATSLPANLTVNPAGTSIALYAGVTIDGVVGQTYGVQSTLDLSNTNSWVGRANVTLTNATQLWYDSQPATQPQTYYRVVPGPISIP